MRHPLRIHRSDRGHQRLGDHLAAEDAPLAAGITPAAIEIDVDLLDLQQVYQARGQFLCRRAAALCGLVRGVFGPVHASLSV